MNSFTNSTRQPTIYFKKPELTASSPYLLDISSKLNVKWQLRYFQNFLKVEICRFQLFSRHFPSFKGTSKARVTETSKTIKRKQHFPTQKILRTREARVIKKSVTQKTRQGRKEFSPSHEGIPSGRNVSEKEFPEIFFYFPKTFFYIRLSWGSPTLVSIHFLNVCLFIVLTSDNSSNLWEIGERFRLSRKSLCGKKG